MIKLDGIIDAINQEVKQPNPTHSNLARLVTLALEEIKNELCSCDEPNVTVSQSTSVPTMDSGSNYVDTPIVTSSKKKLKKSK